MSQKKFILNLILINLKLQLIEQIINLWSVFLYNKLSKGGMFINKIGYLIRQDRINRKLSLKTQSKLSNIFISTLSSIENDKTRNVNRVFFV